MPIYEFVCNKCKKNFEKFVLSMGAASDVKCPACGSEDVTKQFSTFACRSGSSSPSFGGVSGSFGSGGCGGSSGFS